MGFSQFPDNVFVTTASPGQVLQLGRMQVPLNQELVHVVLTIYKYGPHTGSEILKLKAYSDASYQRPVTESLPYPITQIEGLSTYWLGNLRFDFDSYNLNLNSQYYLGLEIENYAPLGNISFIGAVLDLYDQINLQNNPKKPGAAFVVIGRQ